MGVRSLTRDEAERRSALVRVERYEISVDLTDLPSGSAVRCESVVTFTCRVPGAETFVDCAAEVVSATLNGVSLGPPEDGRIGLTVLAEHNVLRVCTVQVNTSDGEGVHKAVDPADGEVYAWTSFEPDEARFVWACFDQPDLKASHVFSVTAPRGWTVLSNSGDPRVEDAGSSRRWTFPATPPLSTYNTVINAGPLHEIRREAAGYQLGIYARRSLASVLERDAEEIFGLTEQGLGFFADVFGSPFPQRKYDQVFMPEFGGAMENFGCVTWSDIFLRRAAPTPGERELFARVLLHEAAHMWFGNVVTMRWWDDLWLNEAFAEFAAHWAASRATSYTDMWSGHLAGGKLNAYLADQGPTSHPIHQPVADVAGAAATFDAITYAKGASVLRQLMAYLGETTFVAGLRAYFARHTWSNTTLQDLLDALGAASGRDLNAWRAGWLETAGTDRLTLEQQDGRLELVATSPHGPSRPHRVSVGAYRRQGGRSELSARVHVEIRQPRTVLELDPGADLYLINDDDHTFATTRPTAGTKAALLADTATLPTAAARGVATATVWDMLLNGEATAAEAITVLSGVLAGDTPASIVEPYLALAADAAELWAPAADRDALTAAVAGTCRQLARDNDRRQVALRALARTAADDDEIGSLRAVAGEDIDLHWRAVARRAELGGDTAGDVSALLERDPDPDAWLRALAVRAATPNAEAKEAAWQALVDRTVPLGSFALITTAFWRPGQDHVLAPYPKRYLDLVPTLDRGGMLVASMHAARLFPLFAVDQAFLAHAEQLARAAAPVVAQAVLERCDLVRRMLNSRR